MLFNRIHYPDLPSLILLTRSSSVLCSVLSVSHPHFLDDISCTLLFSCLLFNAVCSFESLKVDCLSCTWVVPQLPDALSGLRSTHLIFDSGGPPSTIPFPERSSSWNRRRGFCILRPYCIRPHRSRRRWNFYYLQRNYAERRSVLSWYSASVSMSQKTFLGKYPEVRHEERVFGFPCKTILR